jgi:uncharacterized glyoxalase superfamily protein PhnB
MRLAQPGHQPGTCGHDQRQLTQKEMHTWVTDGITRVTRGTVPGRCGSQCTRTTCAGGNVAAMLKDYPDPQVVPYLLYADAGAAMDWLIKVFAFSERARHKNSDGTVRHGELLLDNGGVIMLGSPGTDFLGPAKRGDATQLQCITITDLQAHRERAQAAGASVSEIGIRANHARTYTVDDPEGHRWYFSEPL